MGEVTTTAAYDAEVKRMRDQYGKDAEIPYRPSAGAVPLTPVAPFDQQIGALSREVANAAGYLTECRGVEREAGKRLAEAEQRFAEVSSRLARAMERHRMDGMVDTEKGRP